MAKGSRKIIDWIAKKNVRDRVVFFAAFLLGSVGVIALKVLNFHALWAAAWAVSTLGAYAIVAWRSGKLELEPETVGDNCYYLGFLLTLSSLAYALYRITGSTTGNDGGVDIPELISGFGVALSSTIAGVFLRVMFMHYHFDFVAKKLELMTEVNQAFAVLKGEMSGMLRQMKAFSTEAVQLAAERDERIRKSTESLLGNQYEAFENSSKAFANNLERTLLQAVEQTVGKVDASIEASSKRSGEAIEAMATEMLEARNAFVEQEHKTLNELEERRNRLVAEFAESVRQMRAHSGAMEHYIRVTREAADAMRDNVIPALEEFHKRLDDLPEQPSADDVSSEYIERRPIFATFMRRFWFPKKADRS